MRGIRTSNIQDDIMTQAEDNTIISDLLDVIRDLDDQLDDALKQIEAHDQDTEDI